MRTLTLLSVLTAVALGIPFEQQEAQVPASDKLQRPLVGDLLPVQGHVVEENPAPRPELGKLLQVSAPSPDNKEQEVQEEYVEVPVNEAEEVQSEKQELTEDNEMEEMDAAAPFEEVSLQSELNEDNNEMEEMDAAAPFEEVSLHSELNEDNNEMEEVDVAAPFEEVSLQSELNEDNMEELQGFQGPKVEMMNEIVDEDEEKEVIQVLEDHNDVEAKYDFEQPVMKLEPLTDEEMQRDELLEVSNGVYEEPMMYLEPEAVGGQFMNERKVPDVAMAMEEEAPMLDALGEPLRLSHEYPPHEDGFMRLEPLQSEDQPQMMLSGESVLHGGCPSSGIVLEGKCFQFFTTPKKASEAELFCQQSFPGGHLASITSQNIHNQMMNLMRQNGGTRRTWVGGIRFLDTGRFVWLDGSHWSYADWLWGEPNNTANLEDCIEVLASGKFNDFTCWEPQAYICSYPYQ